MDLVGFGHLDVRTFGLDFGTAEAWILDVRRLDLEKVNLETQNWKLET